MLLLIWIHLQQLLCIQLGASVVIGNVSQNKKVQTVTVDVTTAFDGSAPTLTIGI